MPADLPIDSESHASHDLSHMRQDYGYSLELDQVISQSWYELFTQWFNQACQSGHSEPNAMVIASVSRDGVPRTRTVLAKSVTLQGITFYTNYQSVKARHFAENPHISATFLWLNIHKQVHFSGIVTKVSSQVSDDYWDTRPRESQIGAWASQQSAPLDNVAELDQKYDDYVQEFKTHNHITRPSHWGGYIIQPSRVEFWSGQTGRMHKRVEFTQNLASLVWSVRRLQP